MMIDEESNKGFDEEISNSEVLVDEEVLVDDKKLQKFFVRILAFVIAIVFFISISGNVWSYIRPASLKIIFGSINLSKDSQIKEWKKAVVLVKSETGRGSGFNIEKSGVIITNNHVVENSKVNSVHFPFSSNYSDISIQGYPDVDLAIITLKSQEEYPTLKISNEEVKVGEKITVIGNPFGIFNVVTQGEVIGRQNSSGWDEPILLIKAPIYKGSSGSPVINEKGEVIGVIYATMTVKENEEEVDIGLAIPMNEVLKCLEEF